jgi:NADH-quinone oxidoreductase subunit K
MHLFHAYPLQHYLAVGAILFCAGIYTVLTRRNAVSILMGVELVLNAANVNFVAFARYTETGMQGHVFVVFTIVLAAAEAAVALAIILGLYRNFGSTDVDETQLMKE